MNTNYPSANILSKHVLGKKATRNSSHTNHRKLKFVIVLAALLLLSYFSKATHIVGGALNYTHNGGDSYTITLKLYRDCCPSCAGYPNTVTIQVQQADGSEFPVSRDIA